MDSTVRTRKAFLCSPSIVFVLCSPRMATPGESDIIVISSGTEDSDTELLSDSDSILTFTPTKRHDCLS